MVKLYSGARGNCSTTIGWSAETSVGRRGEYARRAAVATTIVSVVTCSGFGVGGRKPATILTAGKAAVSTYSLAVCSRLKIDRRTHGDWETTKPWGVAGGAMTTWSVI